MHSLLSLDVSAVKIDINVRVNLVPIDPFRRLFCLIFVSNGTWKLCLQTHLLRLTITTWSAEVCQVDDFTSYSDLIHKKIGVSRLVSTYRTFFLLTCGRLLHVMFMETTRCLCKVKHSFAMFETRECGE